ncbi:MAG TPA: ATP-binding protein [Candidatus Eisenbacteria bacterium]|nr:ATP-binding protein [Candidatus Eisenbacteria bacterium]
MRQPTRSTQRATVERLWKRAEEIRSLCGLPPLPPEVPGSPDGPDAASLEFLVDYLLHDLEGNFRRELATRVQLEGLAELMATTAEGSEPGRGYGLLVNYLARALDEPRLWIGVIDGQPPAFTLFRAGDPTLRDVRPERVHLQWLHPDWLHWIALGEGEPALWSGPTGSRKGGPWYTVPIRGEIPYDRFTGEVPACPGSIGSTATCALSRGPLEEMAGGHRACGRCQFRRVAGLVGVEGTLPPERRASLEAVAPSLGPILITLALREALDLEARFRDGVIEELPLGIVAIDERGRVLTWNREAESIVGLSKDQVRTTPLARLLADRSWHQSLVRSLELGVETDRTEHDVVRADGTSVPVEVRTSPLRDGEGRIRGAVGTLVDLSSLKGMEERIRQLDRLAAVGRFVSSVAHELRNPLTGIATGVQYLSRGFPPEDERHESVTFILREVVRLNTIIQDLFTAARPRELALARTPVREIVDRVVRSLAGAAETSGVTIALEGADRWPDAMVDADQVQQVFLNLVENAIHATPPGGRITIRSVRRSTLPEVMVTVEDTGAGMAPEQQARIFEPFYTTKAKGTGLGLFVAHGIVQRHGGTIEVESEPGRGTRFRVALPGAQE